MDPQEMPPEAPIIDPQPSQHSSPPLFPLLLIVISFFILLGVGLYIITRKNLSSNSIIKTSPTITQIPSPTQTLLPSIPPDWKSYKNEKLYFSIRYPNGWFLEEAPLGTGTNQNYLGGIMISDIQPDKYTPSSGNKAVWIYLGKVNPDLSLEEWAKKSFISGYSGTLINQQNITIDGVPALKLTYKEPDQFTFILLKKEGLSWVFSFLPSADHNSTQELEIASSLKLLSTSSYIEQIEVMDTGMEPALKKGQRYTVDRKEYLSVKPTQGDIVLIERPNEPDTQVIKRIIGLPGETIMIKDGKVFINEIIFDEPYLSTPNSTLTYPGFIQEGEKLTIPQDQYFVMGDNRPLSSDSREWGLVTIQNIKAKVSSF